jgi:hypothetical protein
MTPSFNSLSSNGLVPLDSFLSCVLSLYCCSYPDGLDPSIRPSKTVDLRLQLKEQKIQ